jgi:hypothetical protein
MFRKNNVIYALIIIIVLVLLFKNFGERFDFLDKDMLFRLESVLSSLEDHTESRTELSLLDEKYWIPYLTRTFSGQDSNLAIVKLRYNMGKLDYEQLLQEKKKFFLLKKKSDIKRYANNAYTNLQFVDGMIRKALGLPLLTELKSLY